ncbi:exosome complex protein Rrp4 [Candidatus Woesearchaeota archaeon]|nr:exosome complex protein Rrp4 [Candidatus Woesearchaeota archaeon]
MEEKVLAKEKEIVVPGEEIAVGMSFLPGKGTYRVNDKIVAKKLGMLVTEGKVIKLVPLSGVYIPKFNDRIIGKVVDVLMSGWRLSLNCPYEAVLGLKDATSEFIPRNADLTQFFAIGDYVMCKISKVTSQKLVDVTMRGPGLRKLHDGRLVKVNAHKVPRIIGKEGSMVSMLKNATGCSINVGQNGLIWISGSPEQEIRTEEAIRLIEEHAHMSGLTDKVAAFLGVE